MSADAEPGSAAGDAPPAVEARGVHKAFGRDGILDGVDLSVRENEVLLLMGPNGTGKTVLLSCLAGSLQPSDGEVRVFGRPVDEDGGANLSFLLQGGACIDGLSGRETAAFYSRLHPAFTERWRGLVDDLGLADDLDKRTKHYSEGMKRKLELALALAVDVPLYLLDEPTAGVDLSMVQAFHAAIRERVRDGASVVVTSHRPIDADLADRIAFVQGGRVTAVGTPDDLLGGVPRVARIVGAGTESTDLESFVVGDRLFHHGDELRGFLHDGVEPDDLAAAADRDVSVETVEPSYTDAFNYYVHARPDHE